MERKHKIIIVASIIIVALVSFSVGIVFGFKKGFENNYVFDASNRALLITADLKMLRDESISRVKMIEQKEEQLDFEILMHSNYLEHGNPLMVRLYYELFLNFSPDLSPKEFLRSVNNNMIMVAKYRSEHPIKMSVDDNEEFKDTIAKQIHRIEETLRKYSGGNNN